jgi:anaerobic ribonucleoside-triphosphate reductase activating protein
MKIRIANWIHDSIVDGPGLRFSLFTQGCPHHCPHCHNPQTHDPQGGYLVDTDEIITEIKKNPLLSGITITGGEPMLQPEAVLELLQQTKFLGLDSVVYTGYVYEDLLLQNNTAITSILQTADYLIDGPFVESLKSLDLLFRGSSNQRIIDLKKTNHHHQVLCTSFEKD